MSPFPFPQKWKTAELFFAPAAPDCQKRINRTKPVDSSAAKDYTRTIVSKGADRSNSVGAFLFTLGRPAVRKE